MTDPWQELFDFLDGLCDTLETLTEIQKRKTAAVRADDLMTVNECMKKEQAIGLSLRTADQKREKLLAGVGLQGLPLAAMPDRCPAEKRMEALDVVEDVRNCYALYRSAADVARTTLEVNLHQIEKYLEDAPDLPPDGGAIADIRA